jgi:hypothetical protein
MDSIVHAPVQDDLFGAVETELDHEGLHSARERW